MAADPVEQLAKLEVRFNAVKPNSLVMAYAPWCPACKAAAASYVDAAKRVNKIKGLRAVTLNVTEKPTIGVSTVPAFFTTNADGKWFQLDRTSPRTPKAYLTHLLKGQKGQLTGGAALSKRRVKRKSASRKKTPARNSAGRKVATTRWLNARGKELEKVAKEALRVYNDKSMNKATKAARLKKLISQTERIKTSPSA